MHSLCGIIGSCRLVLNVTLYLPSEAAAWTQSLCASLNDLRFLHTLTKDLERSKTDGVGSGAGKREGMDIGWRPRKSVAMWSVSQVRRFSLFGFGVRLGLKADAGIVFSS